MGSELPKPVARWRWVTGGVGVFLVFSSLGIVFCNPIAAGLFLVVGAGAVLASALRPESLASLELSLSGLRLSLHEAQKAAVVAVDALAKIEEVERRLLIVACEIALNRGTDWSYMSSRGNIAEFAVYDAIVNSGAKLDDPQLGRHLQMWDDDLRQRLIAAAVGVPRRGSQQDLARLAEVASSRPSESELRRIAAEPPSLATSPELQPEVEEVIRAYGDFIAQRKMPHEGLIARLAAIRERKGPASAGTDRI